MNKKLVFSIISFFIIIIIIAVFFLVLKPQLSGNVSLTTNAIENQNEYTHTKAICNESNFCQDYEITCKNKQVVSQFPITGAVIQHNANWKDPRNNTDLCE